MKTRPFHAASKGFRIAAAAALGWGLCGPAQATHKSWTHINGGGSCVKAGVSGHTSSSVQINEALWNRNLAETKRILCPVNLSGSFDSEPPSTRTIRRHTKVPALRAEVHYYDSSLTADISCVLVGLNQRGTVRGSEFLYSCGADGGCRDGGEPARDRSYVGAGVLKFAVASNTEKRGIQDAATFSNVRSLSYHCLLTTADPQNGWSGITGVLMQICQSDPETSGYGVCRDL